MFRLIKAIKEHVAISNENAKIRLQEIEHKANRDSRQLEQEFQQQHGMTIEEFQSMIRNK